MTQTWRVLVGDVREQLATLPAESVQCCVTSPPYWGLRDYVVAGQIGREPTPQAYVDAMVEVFRGVWRVLKDDGIVWLNIGDSYHNYRAWNDGGQIGQQVHKRARHGQPAAGGQNRNKRLDGLKEKDLIGIPWRVAFAIQADGWYLRSDIIWAKPNPMPESVQDRPTKAHEYVFLLSKSERYFFDQDAVREPHVRMWDATNGGNMSPDGFHKANGHMRTRGHNYPMPHPNGANVRTVWNIATRPYPEAHFATFPEALPERCIKAGSRLGDVVLDPFAGSGTTGAVAVRLGRSFVGVELNPAYAELARTRIGGAAPLFAVEAGEARALRCGHRGAPK